MFTDGNGDFTPSGDVWQIASSFTTASGMLFATLGVSYILSVLGAVADKRSFANSVTGLRMRSEEFLQSGWDGDDFHNFDLLLDTLSSELNQLAEQHKSYPIFHYYHSEGDEEASAIAVVILFEALTLLQFGVPDEEGPNSALVASARSSTQDYLETLNTAFIEPAEQVPPAPDLDRLHRAGIPTVSDKEFARLSTKGRSPDGSYSPQSKPMHGAGHLRATSDIGSPTRIKRSSATDDIPLGGGDHLCQYTSPIEMSADSISAGDS